MKKLMMILLMIPMSLWAADQNEVCKRNTLVMVVLQNKVNGIYLHRAATANAADITG